MIKQWLKTETMIVQWLRYPQNVLMLMLRLGLAWIFFKSGLLKIQSWESTLSLFEYAYAVPFLSSNVAAYAATIAELFLPPLLAVGLLTRPVALALFVFNIVAWLSYPDVSPAGVKEHQTWALGFLILIFGGSGVLSGDFLLRQRRPQPSPRARLRVEESR